MNFKHLVLNFVKKIPKGKVVSYGQVASACGHPRAARQVGGILRGLDTTLLLIPWWRVVNSKGEISIRGNWTATKQLQRDFLEKDGVKVSEDFKIHPHTFWRPKLPGSKIKQSL